MGTDSIKYVISPPDGGDITKNWTVFKSNSLARFPHDNPDNHYFSCRNKRENNGLCRKAHHIRVDNLTRLVKNSILDILYYAKYFEDEFTKLVIDENYRRIQFTQKKNQQELSSMLSRDKELDILIEKLFEEKILGNLTEERFLKLTNKYEEEQLELKQKIKNLKKIVLKEKNHEMNSDSFLEIIKKYSKISELTSDILHEFIDKIVVHHREEIDGIRSQRIEIFYKMIGYVQIPSMTKRERESYLVSFSRTKKSRLPVQTI